jgi:hypothetical protein
VFWFIKRAANGYSSVIRLTARMRCSTHPLISRIPSVNRITAEIKESAPTGIREKLSAPRRQLN